MTSNFYTLNIIPRFNFNFQVSSRIQKYFLKLAKARLPIPGRGPSSIMMGQSKKVCLIYLVVYLLTRDFTLIYFVCCTIILNCINLLRNEKYK